MLQIFINSFQLFHSRQSRHLPSNFYMGFMFSSLPCPWFKVIGRVLFHIYFAYFFLVCLFFLFLCKGIVSFHFLFCACPLCSLREEGLGELSPVYEQSSHLECDTVVHFGNEAAGGWSTQLHLGLNN